MVNAFFWGVIANLSLVLGIVLDGIPETALIGLSILDGGTVSLTMLMAATSLADGGYLWTLDRRLAAVAGELSLRS